MQPQQSAPQVNVFVQHQDAGCCCCGMSRRTCGIVWVVLGFICIVSGIVSMVTGDRMNGASTLGTGALIVLLAWFFGFYNIPHPSGAGYSIVASQQIQPQPQPQVVPPATPQSMTTPPQAMKSQLMHKFNTSIV